MPASLVIAGAAAFMANFEMAADHMFLAPASLSMRPAARNTVDKKRLVVGIVLQGEARA